MSTTTIRLTTETHAVPRAIAARENKSIQAVVERLVSDYRRRQILDDGNRAYAALRRDPVAWAAELEERAAWEVTLADGLDELQDGD